MTQRPSIPKSIRFEVFKRDNFTCQYCGAKAPEVVLHLDHIRPVADGGGSEIMNLATSCEPCNLGKRARLLDDRSSVERQRAQIEELEARREQLEMMLAWRDEAQSQTIDTVEAVSDRIGQRTGWWPNENGKADIRRWLAKFSLQEVLAAMDIAFDQYLQYSKDKVTEESWSLSFRKIPGIAGVRRSEADKPYLRRLLYIQGILRNRWKMPYENYVDMLEEMHVDYGAPIDFLELAAKRHDYPQDIWQAIDAAKKAGRFQ